jgi:hypothetical protein
MYTPITSRRSLWYALAEAAEMEHAICIQYLFAAFSLKKDASEGGLSPRQSRFVQDAAATLLLVARQEMEHLGLVTNLLTATGGAPYFRRPDLPKPAGHYGNLGAFSLTRFSPETLQRFIEFEKPEPLNLRRAIRDDLRTVAEDAAHADDPHRWHRGRFDAALEVILRQIGTHTHWEYGEAWIPDAAHRSLSCSAAWYAATPGASAMAAFRARTETLSAQGVAPAGARTVLENPSLPAVGQPVDPTTAAGRVDEARAAGLTTCVTIALLAGDHLLAVLVFFYRTYQAANEDDGTVQLIVDMLNTAFDGEDPPLGRSLFEGEEASAPSSTLASTSGEVPAPTLLPEAPSFSSIGAFYRLLKKGLRALVDTFGESAVFMAPPSLQVTNAGMGLIQPGWHNINVTAITDLASALKGIDQIIEEGEGASGVSDTSHYGRFLALSKQYKALRAAYPTFEAARPVVSNPITFFPLGVGPEARERLADQHTFVDHPFTRGVVDLFDAVYELLLHLMMRFYGRPDETDAGVAQLGAVIFGPMMTEIIRPLGEVITRLPASAADPASTAGPTFAFYRDTEPLPHAGASRRYFAERMAELARACDTLCQDPLAPLRLRTIRDNLLYVSTRFEAMAAPPTATP